MVFSRAELPQKLYSFAAQHTKEDGTLNQTIDNILKANGGKSKVLHDKEKLAQIQGLFADELQEMQKIRKGIEDLRQKMDDQWVIDRYLDAMLPTINVIRGAITLVGVIGLWGVDTGLGQPRVPALKNVLDGHEKQMDEAEAQHAKDITDLREGEGTWMEDKVCLYKMQEIIKMVKHLEEAEDEGVGPRG
jgi:hypothetical protein